MFRIRGMQAFEKNIRFDLDLLNWTKHNYFRELSHQFWMSFPCLSWHFYLDLTDVYFRGICNQTSWVNLKQTRICWISTFTSQSTYFLLRINQPINQWTSLHLYTVPATVIRFLHTQYRHQIVALSILIHCNTNSDVISVFASAVHRELILDRDSIWWLWCSNTLVSSSIYQSFTLVSGNQDHTWNCCY